MRRSRRDRGVPARARAAATGSSATPQSAPDRRGRRPGDRGDHGRGGIPFLDVDDPPGTTTHRCPTMKEIEAAGRTGSSADPITWTGLDLNEEAQLELFKTPGAADQRRRRSTPSPEPGQRYFTNNAFYGLGDAAHHAGVPAPPAARRSYLEVGSGWTTALALDTNDRWLDWRLRITCIEPNPIDLEPAGAPGRRRRGHRRARSQDVDVQRGSRSCEPNDILFIDCSHVVKTGSDAHHLITPGAPRGAAPASTSTSTTSSGPSSTRGYGSKRGGPGARRTCCTPSCCVQPGVRDRPVQRLADRRSATTVMVGEKCRRWRRAPGGALWLRRR